MKLAVVGLVVLVAGCRHGATTSPRSVDTSPPSNASAPPPGFEALGAPCEPKPRPEIDGAIAEVACTNGRVSHVLWHLADRVGQPAEASVVAERSVAGDPSSRLLVTDEAVWMRTADGARRPRGTTWAALPAAMNDAQRAEIQRAAGLPAEPLLASAAAWKAALVRSGPTPPR